MLASTKVRYLKVSLCDVIFITNFFFSFFSRFSTLIHVNWVQRTFVGRKLCPSPSFCSRPVIKTVWDRCSEQQKQPVTDTTDISRRWTPVFTGAKFSSEVKSGTINPSKKTLNQFQKQSNLKTHRVYEKQRRVYAYLTSRMTVILSKHKKQFISASKHARTVLSVFLDLKQIFECFSTSRSVRSTWTGSTWTCCT